MNETQQLADYVTNLEYGELPPRVIAAAKLAIRDSIGVTLFASRLEWSQIAAEVAQEIGGRGRSTVWGHEWKTTPSAAAMANGTAAAGIELDDRSSGLDVHNGGSVVPAAIAVAEQVVASGADLILAVVCGYEVANRLARATRMRMRERFYPSSIRNIFGVTTAAAKLLGLNQQQLVHALGITGSMAAGLQEHTQDPYGTMVKRLQGGGWPAHGGVLAATLASKGFTGPATVLEGKHGICRTFCTDEEPDISALVQGLGDAFEILQWEPKLYSAWGGGHTSIDAVNELRSAHGIRAEQVDRIALGIGGKYFDNAFKVAPQSVLAMQHHMPYVIATAFFYNFCDPSIWEDSILDDPRIAALAARIEVQPRRGDDRKPACEQRLGRSEDDPGTPGRAGGKRHGPVAQGHTEESAIRVGARGEVSITE